MLYSQLYRRVSHLLGNRKEADELVKVWVQDAVAIVVGLHPLQLPLRTAEVEDFEQDTQDLWRFEMPEGWVTVNTLSYLMPTGLLQPIDKGNTDDFVYVPTVLWPRPEKFITMEDEDGKWVYLWPKLTGDPELVRVTGVAEYIYPTEDDEVVPLSSFLIPSVTAMAVAFGKVYLGEAEQAGTLRRLHELLTDKTIMPEGQQDTHGPMGVQVQ